MNTPNWEEVDLEFFLREDSWAFMYGIGILTNYFPTFVDNSDRMQKYRQRLTSWLKRLMDGGEHTPVEFIKLALDKGFRPDWLDWAIERGLYNPNQETEKPLQAAPGKKVEERFPVATQQNNAILNWLKSNNHDPEKLPVPNTGKSGVKKLCRDVLCASSRQLFSSVSVFNTAWERLRANAEIKDAQ